MFGLIAINNIHADNWFLFFYGNVVKKNRVTRITRCEKIFPFSRGWLLTISRRGNVSYKFSHKKHKAVSFNSRLVELFCPMTKSAWEKVKKANAAQFKKG